MKTSFIFKFKKRNPEWPVLYFGRASSKAETQRVTEEETHKKDVQKFKVTIDDCFNDYHTHTSNNNDNK